MPWSRPGARPTSSTLGACPRPPPTQVAPQGTRREPFNFTPTEVNSISFRSPHVLRAHIWGASYAWCLTARRNQEKYTHEKYYRSFLLTGLATSASSTRARGRWCRGASSWTPTPSLSVARPARPPRQHRRQHRWRRAAGSTAAPGTATVRSRTRRAPPQPLPRPRPTRRRVPLAAAAAWALATTTSCTTCPRHRPRRVRAASRSS